MMGVITVTTDEVTTDCWCAICGKAGTSTYVGTVNMEAHWDAVQPPTGWYVTTGQGGEFDLVCSHPCFEVYAVKMDAAEREREEAACR